MAVAAPLISHEAIPLQQPPDLVALSDEATQLAKDRIAAVAAAHLMPRDAHWFNEAQQVERRTEMDLNSPTACQFIDGCEFVSLGAFCGSAVTLQSLGLKKFTYPFDWMRSPMDGVSHLIENSFEDFLTFRAWKKDGDYDVFTGSRWGGSFWHHDPREDKTREMFTRRIERLFGLGEVPASKPRVYLRVLNSTRDLDDTLRLVRALHSMHPCSPFRLLLIIENQLAKAAINLRVPELAPVLFWRVDKKEWDSDHSDMWKRSKLYAEAVAFAIRLWGGVDSGPGLLTLDGIDELVAACEHWDGGDCSSELFRPVNFQGQRLNIPTPIRRQPVQLPRLIGERLGDMQLPSTFTPGTIVPINVFGIQCTLSPPEGAFAGQKVRLQLLDGVITATYSLAAAISTAAIAISLQEMSVASPTRPDCTQQPLAMA